MVNSVKNSLSENNYFNKELTQILSNKNIANAYIFDGPENIGKRENAIKFIAEIILNSNQDQNAVKKIKENNHPDFMFIEPTYLIKGNPINQSEIELALKPKSNALIRINQIRNIRTFLSMKSIDSNKKFILIEDAHLLNEASSNCLLKTLEEPTNGLFILLTSKFNLLLETITSRCQRIRFKPLTTNQLKKIIVESDNLKDIQDDQNISLDNLIYISNGSPGKLIDNIQICKDIPYKILQELESPILNFQKALFLAKNINDELNIIQQEFLIDYVQYNWWKKTQNRILTETIEEVKINLIDGISPRLSWEVGLLKIASQK